MVLSAMWLAQAGDAGAVTALLVAIPVLIVLSLVIFLIKHYRRCPSNRVLVVYGKLGGERVAQCIHGGGMMVWPIIQDYEYLSLEPITIEVDLRQALTRQNTPVDAHATFTIGISTRPDILQNAAERLLGLSEEKIASTAIEIILGQLRLVIGTLTIEEIDQDREKFFERITENIDFELNKIGLALINMNFRSFTVGVPAPAGVQTVGAGRASPGGLEGKTGWVSAKIPARGGGRGQVELTVSGQKRVLEAVSRGEEIEDLAPVKVVAIEVTETLVVERA